MTSKLSTSEARFTSKDVSIIRRACAHFNYRWPDQLTSGIMMFEGERITIEEFMEQVKLFRE